MKKLAFSLLSVAAVASCGSSDLNIRTGPQAQHPVTGVTEGAVTTATAPSTSSATDSCGASQYQHLVGQPSKETLSLDIPDESRHYGATERVATNDPSRLNFVHSGTAVESVTDPTSTIIRVFCG